MANFFGQEIDNDKLEAVAAEQAQRKVFEEISDDRLIDMLQSRFGKLSDRHLAVIARDAIEVLDKRHNPIGQWDDQQAPKNETVDAAARATELLECSLRA